MGDWRRGLNSLNSASVVVTLCETPFKLYLITNVEDIVVLTISSILSNYENNWSEVEYKEFEPRLKFKPGLKYGWFHLKLYSIFQDLSRRSIETDFLGIRDAA